MNPEPLDFLSCLQKWHRIQKSRALSDKEVEFIVNLIMGWIEKQIGGGENELIQQQQG